MHGPARPSPLAVSPQAATGTPQQQQAAGRPAGELHHHNRRPSTGAETPPAGPAAVSTRCRGATARPAANRHPVSEKGTIVTSPPQSTGQVRRALSTEELQRILHAVRDATDTRQLLTTAIGALYTALLADTGRDPTQVPDGEQVRPGDYAIPASQWQAILTAITGRAQQWGTAAEVALAAAIDYLPAQYDDPRVPAPTLTLPDYRPAQHILVLDRDAVDVIAACEAHLGRLRTFYGAGSGTYQDALHSWHRNLAALFTMTTGVHTHVGKDGPLSLIVRTSSGLIYGLIFHGATRRCTSDGCDALIADDGTTRPGHAGTRVPDHPHLPSYPLNGPRPGTWTFHS